MIGSPEWLLNKIWMKNSLRKIYIYIYKIYRFNLGPGSFSRSLDRDPPREAHLESLQIVGPVSGLWGHYWRVLVFISVVPETAFVV